MFEWDRNNLRKIRVHGIQQQKAEQAIRNNPILVTETTDQGRLIAIVVTDRREQLRVVTAYELDAGQIRDYLRLRVEGE